MMIKSRALFKLDGTDIWIIFDEGNSFWSLPTHIRYMQIYNLVRINNELSEKWKNEFEFDSLQIDMNIRVSACVFVWRPNF